MLVSCTVCGTDVYVDDYDAVTDEAWCSGPGHDGLRMVQPKAEQAARAAKARALPQLPDGIAESYGLYEILPSLISPEEWVDTIVVEYRYGIASGYPPKVGQLASRSISAVAELCDTCERTHREGRQPV
jgi:hypothetical protein